jgi:CheY-like chemotaxis protein
MMAAAQPGILIIEDDIDIREALLTVLTDEGYVVAGVANGREALQQLEECTPALILLDLMMPVMDGWQFREAQRRDERLRDIPVVVISADSEARQKLGGMGDVGFLRKPIELDLLLSEVARRMAG